MARRTKHSVTLSAEAAAQLKHLIKVLGASKSAVVELALASYVARMGAKP